MTSSSSRLAANAMRGLSGLQAGPLSPPLFEVSRRGAALPSAGTIHRSVDVFLRVVRRLGHAEDDPLAVGRRNGRADALERPEQLMGERGRRLPGLRASGRSQQRAQQPERGDSMKLHSPDSR